MRVMVLIRADERSEGGALPDQALLEAMGKYNEALVDAGIMLAGEGLRPSSAGRRVRFAGERRAVSDGPFDPAQGLLAGFWLWQVSSIEEAVEWVKRMPDPMPGTEAEVEIRPVFEAEDFAPSDPTGELRAREEELRARVDAV